MCCKIICVITGVYFFRRLKINYKSHEFILYPGTVVNMTAYHPEANGAVERLHRRLKVVLHARATAATWGEELPWVLLRLCMQPREDTGTGEKENNSHNLTRCSGRGQGRIVVVT
jgi:hypothetical protein